MAAGLFVKVVPSGSKQHGVPTTSSLPGPSEALDIFAPAPETANAEESIDYFFGIAPMGGIIGTT